MINVENCKLIHEKFIRMASELCDKCVYNEFKDPPVEGCPRDDDNNLICVPDDDVDDEKSYYFVVSLSGILKKL